VLREHELARHYEREYTFTPADDEVAIDATKATADNMVTLALPGKLACKPELFQIP